MLKNLLLLLFVMLVIVTKGGADLQILSPITVHAQLWFSYPKSSNHAVLTNSTNDYANKLHITPTTSSNDYANKLGVTPASSSNDYANKLHITPAISSNDVHDGDICNMVKTQISSIGLNSKSNYFNINNASFTSSIESKSFESCSCPNDGSPSSNTDTFGNNIIKAKADAIIEGQKICGTNKDDYIVASEVGDIIFGLRGNDIIMALGGDDLVFGGPGDDFVYGGDGNNQLFGDGGNDNLVGGLDDDLLVGGFGNDRLYGNIGDDILQGGPGADYFDCGDGLDTVVDYNPSQGDIVSSSCENVNLIH